MRPHSNALTRPCATCGKEFAYYPSDKTAKYCSLACRSQRRPTPDRDAVPRADKECRDCGAVLPRIEFTISSRHADGRCPYCKTCARERYRKRRERDRQPCSVQGCAKHAHMRGLYCKHYRLGRTEGTLTVVARVMPPLPSDVTQLDLAWMAGLFDGEGSICISCVRPHRAADQPVYELVISVNMTSESIIRVFASAFGGNARPFTEQARRTMWRWTVYRWKALRVLQALRPYLRLKGPQADLAGTFMGLMSGRDSGSPRLTDTEVAARAVIYEQMAALNNSPWRHRRGTESVTP